MPLPPLIYGTAWKEDATERLTLAALRAGFRAVDTANQRRHYHEAGVGAALARAFGEGLVAREGLFLQSKFTDVAGQDHRLPYDPGAEVEVQVRQSFESSLEHLGVAWLDSYVLHGPAARHGLGERDRRVWRAMEGLAAGGRVRALGASNVSASQLEELWEFARVRPAFVQNRCFAQLGWDAEVREFCRARGVVYQGFSLLTANPHVVRHPEVARIGAARRLTPAQVVFAFCGGLGILPLTGTTDAAHMRQDLEAAPLRLTAAEQEAVGRI